MKFKIFEEIPKIKKKEIENKFLEKIEKGDECWKWIGYVDSKGYGVFSYRFDGKRYFHKASRFSYYYYNGPFDEKLFMCHKCDNPLCVNPNHLFPGTQKKNIEDAVNKNRMAKGTKHGRARLTEKQVKQIRWLSKQGYNNGAIAKTLNVSRDSVYCIVVGKTWKHVKCEEEVLNVNIELGYGTKIGEFNPMSKLTDDEVIEIKKLLSEGLKTKNIADKFNVSLRNIQMISSGESWKHL